MIDVVEIILDTETTGLDPYQGHKIIEIGCVKLVNKIKVSHFHCYLDPEREVPDEAYRIHGISTQALKGQPLFAHKAQEFLSFIEDHILVIHNAQFDLKFLNYELQIIGLPKLTNEVKDTIHISRTKFPGRPANLDFLCKHFKVDLSRREKHGALLDAELLSEVYIHLEGGKQGKIDVSLNSKLDNNPFNLRNKKEVKPARQFDLLEQELTNHLQLLKKIKNPLFAVEEA